MQTLRFEFVAAGMGYTTWRVSGDGDAYDVESNWDSLRADAYYRSISTLSDSEWHREIWSAVGILKSRASRRWFVSEAVLHAFNEWRAVYYWEWSAKSCATMAEFPPPRFLVSGRYVGGRGWVAMPFAPYSAEGWDRVQAAKLRALGVRAVA